jgi:hypothetical protein
MAPTTRILRSIGLRHADALTTSSHGYLALPLNDPWFRVRSGPSACSYFVMINLNASGPYAKKDQLKADTATKFIGIGAPGSSTWLYAKAVGQLANCGTYSKGERVFVSINGARRDRIGLDAIVPELELAAKEGVVFLTDEPRHRDRSYNCGERELAEWLLAQGYVPWAANGYEEWHKR